MIVLTFLLSVKQWQLQHTMRMQMLRSLVTRMNWFCLLIIMLIQMMKIVSDIDSFNVWLICSYLIKATLSNEMSFIGYTYAGELPSCAFGYNSHGLVIILSSIKQTVGTSSLIMPAYSGTHDPLHRHRSKENDLSMEYLQVLLSFLLYVIRHNNFAENDVLFSIYYFQLNFCTWWSGKTVLLEMMYNFNLLLIN